MCSIFIKMICCNKSLTDKDMVYDPANISVPFEDVKKVAASIENVIDDVVLAKIMLSESKKVVFEDTILYV